MKHTDTLAALAVQVGEELRSRRLRLATAESCTGGWIAKLITDVSGSSTWFERGYVTYSNAAKIQDLGVPEALLAEYGAVSEQVVRAMAQGARHRTGTDVSLAVSGVAGPDGGTAAKPVGLVWLAWSDARQTLTARETFPGDREAVRKAACRRALAGVLELLDA